MGPGSGELHRHRAAPPARTFTAFPQDVFEYSDLDLYLMGLMPPEDVEPWYVLENVTDCIDSQAPMGACAPPDYFGFEAESYTVTATRRDITIEDVIAAEGPRVPAWPNTPDAFDVSFVVITRPDEELDEESKQQIDAIVNRSIDLFDQQTRGYAHLVNRTVPPQGGDTTGGMDETGGTTDPTGADDSTGDGGSTGPDTASGTAGGASESPSTVTDPEPTGGESSGDGVGGSGEGDGGCGCRSDGSGSDGALAALGLVVLAAARTRRRRDRRSAQSVPQAAGT